MIKEKEIFKHLMLDIETMGIDSFSSIMSIAAVEFNIETGNIGRTFEVNIDLQDSINSGLIINSSTIEWWVTQNKETFKLLLKDKKFLHEALILFSEFCSKKEYYIWGNSARFDCGILNDAYNIKKLKTPWQYYNERDVRTLVSFAPNIKKECIFKGIKHKAIDDCKHQINYCSQIWRKISIK